MIDANTICIIRQKNVHYPKKESLFRPSKYYPEYYFKDDVDTVSVNVCENSIYDIVRNGFIKLELDIYNLGTKYWNPLGKYIKPGEAILIKPNMVLHKNPNGCGEECMYTHPAIVAAAIDYVCIALKGIGKIVIGDAPVQECDFNFLCRESGYYALVEFYKNRGIDIELVDFRNVKTYERDGLHFLQEEKESGVLVQLNEVSAFSRLKNKDIERLRITNYDPRIMQCHHSGKVHEYRISEYVLNADVIINLPKPKTHRKAGITASLKNIIGINANKEYLPHHTIGSKEEGGDAYSKENIFLELANSILDIKNILEHEGNMDLASEAGKLCYNLQNYGSKITGEKYWEGSWYGNDTIWRTILDLNRVLFYADKKGVLKKTKQRRQFIIADMIVSGQKEGPLEPVPIYSGAIVMGEDPLKLDRVVCSMMGFDYLNIPSLSEKMETNEYSITNQGALEIVSNFPEWNHASLKYIMNNSFEFQPTNGWEEKLGNKYKERIYNSLKKCSSSIYIFGAGKNGRYAYKLLSERGIHINGFCDNNCSIFGKEIVDGVYCTSLDKTELDATFVIAARECFANTIKKQIVDSGRSVSGVINGA